MLSPSSLALQEEKHLNILLAPATAPMGVLRRGDAAIVSSTKKRVREQLAHEALNGRAARESALDFDPH